GAVTAVVRAAQLSSQTGSEQKLEVFVNLARRLQSLVHREISILDELENEIEDPDLLKGLFHVDHLATRIRRHAENLAVLGGAVSRRQWSNPVSMTEVLRSAIAEVEQYSRVKLVPPIDGELRGHAVADVIHLLAELIENASVFSAPQTQVLLRAGLVTSGLAVEVEDRGLGMPVGEQNRMNALLADPDQVNVASLLADGRIGLYVVSQLARRHGIHVRLQSNIYGGVQAVLVVPQALLGTAPGMPGAAAGTGDLQPHTPAGAGAARPVRLQGQTQAPGQGHQHGYAQEQGHVLGQGHGFGRAQGPVPASPPGVRPAEASPAQDGDGTALGTGAAPPASDTLPASGAPLASTGGAGSGTGQARRRHAQHESGWLSTESGDSGRNDGAPLPLPVRGVRQDRPTPAAAVPGVSAADRAAVEAHAGILPTPRTGAVRGTMGKPPLPRRRAQEHIVPQLRGGPAPRQDMDTVPGHDPGLMAAFQRGVGLAEAQQHMEHMEHMESQERTDLDSGHLNSSSHPDAAHMGSPHTGSAHMPSAHMESGHMESGHVDSSHMESAHTDSAHLISHQLQSAPSEFTDPVPPISQQRAPAPASDGARGAGRSDGSAPAG
ncbi:ATP-binding protein, partial [Streptomyces sp. NPDC049099]|uniref:ATP-binding protein n=1 Tax=Streptomyces sp. NPDC049099 TaxID=3155768 RepID=UPI0034496E8F